MNRRRFLEAATFACGAAVVHASPAGREPACSFPGTPRERLAVASYPFRAEFDPNHHKRSLLEFPQMVVERFGLHGIEPLDEHFESLDAAYLAKFRQKLQVAKSRVVNIPVGRLEGSFYDADAAHRELAMANARKWIDVAVAVGSPSVRLHIQAVKGTPPDAARAAAALRSVAVYGAQKNIVVNLENDDPASEEAFFIVDVIEKAATPWLRALPDFCNSMILKKGEDYNYRGVTAMFQHACNICHAKELETDEGKLYQVDVAKTFGIAAKAGYKGFFSMEWDSDGDPYAGTTRLIELSLKALGG